MIEQADLTEQERLYIRDRGGLWRIVGYYSGPSVVTQDIVTGERETFGLGGATEKTYQSILGIKVGRGAQSVVTDP